MLREKDLFPFRPEICLQPGLTLRALVERIQRAARKQNLPLVVQAERLRRSGLSGSGEVDCLLISHPDHRHDYFSLAISLTPQGDYAFVGLKGYGMSRQLKKQEMAAIAKNMPEVRAMEPLRNEGPHPSARERLIMERMWYVKLITLFDEITRPI